MKVDEIKVKTETIIFAAKEWGKRSNANSTILALHGWLDNADSFLPMAEQFANQHHFVALDLPGHGMSSWQPDGILLHSLQEVKSIIDAINIISPKDPIILLGHSLGAGYACLIAATLKEKIQKLVCLDAIGPLSVDEKSLPHFFSKSLTQHKRMKGKNLPSYKSIEDAITARAKNTCLEHKYIQLLVERSLQKIENGKYIWRNDPRLMQNSIYRLSENQIKSFLKEIICPTLLIEPDDGWPGFSEPPYVIRKRYIHNLHVKNIKGHHHAHMDQAYDIYKIINNFI